MALASRKDLSIFVPVLFSLQSGLCVVTDQQFISFIYIRHGWMDV